MRTTEEILRNRVKFIGEGEWTLLGTPQEVIDELNRAFMESVQELADTTSPNLLLNKIVDTYYAPSTIEEQSK